MLISRYFDSTYQKNFEFLFKRNFSCSKMSKNGHCAPLTSCLLKKFLILGSFQLAKAGAPMVRFEAYQPWPQQGHNQKIEVANK